MEKEQNISVLWDYYKAAAEIQGMDKEKEAQANYSLLWAFQGSLEELPSLVLAFLGDSTAMDALNWSAASPTDWEDFLLEGQPLNESQAEAVRLALAAPLSFIQGPPGTGKTETILNLASCAARMNGGRSVAIVSSNKDALKNIQEKIASFSDAAPNRRWLRSHYAALGKASIREEFLKAHPDDPLCAFGRPAEEEIVRTDPRPFSREKNIRAEDFLEKYPVISSTIHSLKNCFRDGNTYLYDYVIMDESSQTNTVAGLVAMSCARHLVLVGDPKQLPPVVPEHYVTRLDQLVRERGWAIPAEHLAAPDRSFLDVCLDVFRGRTAQVTLRFHYRCHPGIIGFCAKEIYREERLEICTPHWDTRVQTPIKVLWFEGNYCEKRTVRKKDACKKRAERPQSSETGAIRISKHNRKQVQCFMEEEWPALWERLQLPEQERPSVCILSPFLGQLASLEEAIQNDLSARKHPPKGLKLFLEDGDTNQSGQGFEPPTLTIHKSQGHEYDIVYLLPAEDGDWEWPWSQKKRLVNVAVSRAKKELRLILSSTLMDEEIQQTLTGRPVLPEKRGPSPGTEQDELYLQKLVRYVREENEAMEQKTGVVGYPASTYEFGFHRSVRTSIFDRIPWEQAIRIRDKQKGEFAMNELESDSKRCVEQALIDMIKESQKSKNGILTLYKNVKLRDICFYNHQKPALEEALKDAQWDFVVARIPFSKNEGKPCNNQHFDRVLLAIDVRDGSHRALGDEGNKLRASDDAKKDFCDRSLNASCMDGNAKSGQDPVEKGTFTYLRLDDDGSSCCEVSALKEHNNDKYYSLEDLLKLRLDTRYKGLTVHVQETTTSERIEAQNMLWAESCIGTLLKRTYPVLKQYLNEKGKNSKEEKSKALFELSDEFIFSEKGEKQKVTYSNLYVQALYIMRYMYAYAYEYKLMYQKLLDRLGDDLPDTLSVTSIGCGNMVDYWSLRTALNEYSKKTNVHYTGVDYSDWKKRIRIQAAEGDEVTFVKQDAAEYLKGKNQSDSASDFEVYVFPKSITEFGDRESYQPGAILKNIAEELKNALCKSTKPIWLLISLPRSYRKQDLIKYNYLLEKGVQAAGYITKDDTQDFSMSPADKDNKKKIFNEDRTFRYPMKILLDLCDEIDAANAYAQETYHLSEEELKRKIRVPITSIGYDKYIVLLYEKA